MLDGLASMVFQVVLHRLVEHVPAVEGAVVFVIPARPFAEAGGDHSHARDSPFVLRGTSRSRTARPVHLVRGWLEFGRYGLGAQVGVRLPDDDRLRPLGTSAPVDVLLAAHAALAGCFRQNQRVSSSPSVIAFQTASGGAATSKRLFV